MLNTVVWIFIAIAGLLALIVIIDSLIKLHKVVDRLEQERKVLFPEDDQQ